MKEIIKRLQSIIGENRVLKNEALKEHTYFKIGGPAKILVKVNSIVEIKKIIQLCMDEDINYYVIGNGTNILVPDEGLDAVIIKIAEDYSDYRIQGDKVYVQSGMLLSTLSKKIAKASLSGFEFASGIPGTVGGAIYMNAGAYGGEMKDIVEYVQVLDDEGKVRKIMNKDLELGYRKSIISKKNYIVLSVCFRLIKGDIHEIMKNIRHCGFVVNRGNATCKDILQLIEMVKKIVSDQFNVTLEREVRILGRD
jgi:UDP-N-acetylmuramate dehydrogenase